MSSARACLLSLAILSGFGITVFFVMRSDVPSASGAFEGTDHRQGLASQLMTAGYGFAVTLTGVALGATYRRLVALQNRGVQRISIRKVTAAVAGSVDFYLGIVGSPIVFGLLWQSLGDISLAGLTVMALQNGFASHAVVGQLVGGGTASKSDPASPPSVAPGASTEPG